MNFKKDFAAFILTHGRPDRVLTYKKIRDCGYTGKIYLIIDSKDKHKAKYIENYGEEVIVFDKEDYKGTFDMGDNFEGTGTVLFARNACFPIAKKLGLSHFIQLDDDYDCFNSRYDHENKYVYKSRIAPLDKVFKALVDFHRNTNIASIALSQNGEWFGGAEGNFGKKIFLKRKAMNSFVCDTNKPIQFIGRLNDDVNTYVKQGSKGGIFFTTNWASLHQQRTQANVGGLTEEYLDKGTYAKSFYTIMFHPAGVGMMMMGATEKRIHHKINYKYVVPKIIDEKHKKVSNV